MSNDLSFGGGPDFVPTSSILSRLEAEDAETESVAAAPLPPTFKPSTTAHPLRQYSLLDKVTELEAIAGVTKPLLGEFVMEGQATMIYAQPNAGKTLIVLQLVLDAIDAGRIAPENVYYVNADDSLAGLTDKARLMQDVGAHMLAPGREGFRAVQLMDFMNRAVDEGTAAGTCLILDTMKKFTDLMDKKRSSEVAQVCRSYVMAGGTVIALGHTAKNPNADGTPRYQGTTDLLEDFDAVYVGEPMTSREGAAQKVVRLTRLKCRADSPEKVAYVYDGGSGASYGVKLASLRSINPSELDDYVLEEEQINDSDVKDALSRLIESGSLLGKMALGKAAANECGVSNRAAIEVLERYTGTVPGKHCWRFYRASKGVQVYGLLDPVPVESSENS